MGRQPIAEMQHIVLDARGVDDEIQTAFQVRNHQIIADATRCGMALNAVLPSS